MFSRTKISVKKNYKQLWTLLFLFLILIFVNDTWAGPPSGINYQGRYKVNGVPVNSETTFTFELYNVETGGSPIWSATTKITPENGLFNYVLNCSTVDFRNNDAWLQVTAGDTALTPRERLQASAYAFYATSAAYAFNAGSAEIPPSISVSTINATATTPYGGINITTNTFVQGRFSVGPGITSLDDTLTVKGSPPLVDWGTPMTLDATHLTGGRMWRIFSSGGAAVEGQGKFIIQDRSGGGDRLTIDASGNVGIGTTTPAAKLDVTGMVRSTWAFSPGNGTNFQSDRYMYDDSANYRTAFSSNVYIVGYSSAAKYYGDGSGLTGITATVPDTITGPKTFTSSVTITGAGGLGVTYGIVAGTLTLTGNTIYPTASTITISGNLRLGGDQTIYNVNGSTKIWLGDGEHIRLYSGPNGWFVFHDKDRNEVFKIDGVNNPGATYIYNNLSVYNPAPSYTQRFKVWREGGVRVGSTDSDPGVNNLAVDGNITTIGSGNIYGGTNNLTLYGGTSGYGTDSYFKLNSAANNNNIEAVLQGTSKFEIMQQGSWTRIARFYSGGGVRIGNTDTDPGANNLAVDGQIRPGGSPDRYIYDDSTNFRTAFSSNVYIKGNLSVDGPISGTISNADKLDNLDSSDFVRRTGYVSEEITGAKTFTSSVTITAAGGLGVTYGVCAGTLTLTGNEIYDSAGVTRIKIGQTNIITGAAGSADVTGGAVYINNTDTTGNRTILGLATAGTQKFRFDNDGDLEIINNLFLTGGTKGLYFGSATTAPGIYYDQSGAQYRIRFSTKVRVDNELVLGGNVIWDTGNIARITLATAGGGETVINSTVTAAGALKSSQNRIIDSGGNTRVTFATSGDNVTLTGQTKVSGQLIVTGSATVQSTGIALGTSGARNILDDSSSYSVRVSTSFYATEKIGCTVAGESSPGITLYLRNDPATTSSIVNFDVNDYLSFHRPSNVYRFMIGGTEKLKIEPDWITSSSSFTINTSAPVALDIRNGGDIRLWKNDNSASRLLYYHDNYDCLGTDGDFQIGTRIISDGDILARLDRNNDGTNSFVVADSADNWKASINEDGKMWLADRLLLENTKWIAAKNTSGSEEAIFVPLGSDNKTYIKMGSGNQLYIQNQSGSNVASIDSSGQLWTASNYYMGGKLYRDAGGGVNKQAFLITDMGSQRWAAERSIASTSEADIGNTSVSITLNSAQVPVQFKIDFAGKLKSPSSQGVYVCIVITKPDGNSDWYDDHRVEMYNDVNYHPFAMTVLSNEYTATGTYTIKARWYTSGGGTAYIACTSMVALAISK